jgi:hypothetical protein
MMGFHKQTYKRSNAYSLMFGHICTEWLRKRVNTFLKKFLRYRLVTEFTKIRLTEEKDL